MGTTARHGAHSLPGKFSHHRVIFRAWALCIFLLLTTSAQATGVFESGFESTPAVTGHLNDTGITWSGQAPHGNAITCDPDHPAGQDCHYGRDALASMGQLYKAGGGNAGFDFTKISNNGAELHAGASLGSGADDWACTRDNVTGLMWEVKVADPDHLRDWEHHYHWYDPSSPDGNSGAVGDITSCSDTLDGQPCNTQNYVQAVNAQGLCGASDWRMPSRQELLGIVDYGHINPAIDSWYFPNTSGSWFWTGSPHVYPSSTAWVVNFSVGHVGNYVRTHAYRVRLVRAGE